MVAYPFAPAPRFQDFISALERHGVKVHDSGMEIFALDGAKTKLLYLEYTPTGSSKRQVPLTFASESDVVELSVVRSICNVLGLDSKPFGIDLSGPVP
jgi:hypothetical protein